MALDVPLHARNPKANFLGESTLRSRFQSRGGADRGGHGLSDRIHHQAPDLMAGLGSDLREPTRLG